jgi:hypothetical protein
LSFATASQEVIPSFTGSAAATTTDAPKSTTATREITEDMARTLGDPGTAPLGKDTRILSKLCTVAMGLFPILDVSQPGIKIRRPEKMRTRSGKLPTRTRRSDELRPGPFSRRNLVDYFPPRAKPAEPKTPATRANAS